MSNFGAVPTAILSAIGAAMSCGGTRDGFIAYSKIPPDQFPFAMVYNPQKSIDRGEFQHGVETTANPVLIVYHAETVANINDDMVAIEAKIALDPTLGGVVEDAWVSLMGRDESVESEFTAAVFQIDTVANV